jgi:rhodanese-related sulfurtransferase
LSAARADRLEVDWQTCGDCDGFIVDNPNQGRTLRRIDCDTLAEWIDGPAPPIVVDVRTEQEYLGERIASARRLDAGLLGAISLLDRRTRLMFYCNNGIRSTRMARHHVGLGFTDVSVLQGGMVAWRDHFGRQSPNR